MAMAVVANEDVVEGAVGDDVAAATVIPMVALVPFLWKQWEPLRMPSHQDTARRTVSPAPIHRTSRRTSLHTIIMDMPQ